MTTPPPAERDALLTAFSKALFKRDVDAIYRTVTPDFVWRLPIGPDAPVAREIGSPEQLADYFDARERTYDGVRFHDVVYHHAPEATFMTFRVTARRKDGDAVDALGMERYLFRDGRIALKDAYWKRIGVE
ncbi:nuclear transport factor 2 family protein [Bradyrhizobium sp. LHD-71]|uniref:nuclear transport factor 2 family protein n=1 Tax=Bradyrhizobium sp. LHD-71 TaxID=3072141 RepID=UPI00280F4767|nr:nuclear transport factor 2 family protein [Bradyrhizobium sp. LHD-71]MDQ8729098.1 nuclear transport factor 2 family protein [Bradyrhizobium sp. LHD-71]